MVILASVWGDLEGLIGNTERFPLSRGAQTTNSRLRASAERAQGECKESAGRVQGDCKEGARIGRKEI